MAEKTWLEGSFSNPYEDTTPSDEGMGYLDPIKAAGARLLGGIPSDLGAGIRAISQTGNPESRAQQSLEMLGVLMQDFFGYVEDGIQGSISEEGMRKLQADVTSPDFWTLGSFIMKGSSMAPDIAAAVVPSVIFPGYAAAVASAAATGGVLSAAAVTDDLYDEVDGLDDARLQEEVLLYRQLRESGMGEEEARREFNRHFIGFRPAIAGMLGAITNVVGPAGQAARMAGGGAGALTSEVGEGILKRVGKGMAEGAISEGIQEGTEDYVVQDARVEHGMQDEINIGQVATSAGTGAVMGGVFGGGIGAMSGRGGDDQKAITDTVLTGNTTNAPNMPTAPTPVATPVPVTSQGNSATPGNVVVPPAEPVGPGAEQVQVQPPVQSAVTSVVEGSSPSPEQAVALNASKTAPVAQIPQPEPVGPQFTPPPVEQAPIPQAEPVGPQFTPPPIEQAPIPQPEPVGPQFTPPPVEQAPIEQAPVAQPQRPAGPRILEDRTSVDNSAENAARIKRNIKEMEAPAEQPKGKNRTKSELEKRQHTNDEALRISTTILPELVEADIFDQRPAKITAARTAILNRAKKMDQAARDAGVELPRAFRDNTKSEASYNPQTLVLMEARKLASKDKPTLKDIQDFFMRDLEIKAGMADDVIATRRAEGDAAFRTEGDVDTSISSMQDADTPLDRADPEAQLMEAEERGQSVRELLQEDDVKDRSRGKKPEDIPDSVQKAFDESFYTIPKKTAKAPAVEVKKKRTFTKPEAKTVSKATPAVEKPPVSARKPKEHYESVSKSLKEGLKAWKDGNELLAEKASLADRLAKLSDADWEKLAPAWNRDMDPGVTMEPEKGHAAIDRTVGKVTPKVTTKVSALQAKVREARKATDTNPTAAQAMAGNYRKGKVSVQGLRIAIENPRGSVRRNRDPNGPAWSVRMRNDYGYIEGTRGADGEPIDVYLGPDLDASHVFVVNQIDADTMQFDEHKAMVGFRSEEAAIRAYEAAFSDGRGLDRMGGVTRMSMAEFKRWSKGNPKQSTDLNEEQAADVRDMLMEEELISAIESQQVGDRLPEGYVRDTYSNTIVRPIATIPASEVMAELDLRTLDGPSRIIAGTIRNVLTRNAGDVNVHFLTVEDLDAAHTFDQRPWGYHISNGLNHDIFVDHRIANDPDILRHVILHEVTHAATTVNLHTDPTLQRDVDFVMRALRAELEMMSAADRAVADYSMLNRLEFIAESASNAQLQELMSRIPAPDYLSEMLNLKTPVRNLWDALIHAIRRSLGLPRNTVSMLDAAMRVTGRSMRPTNQGINLAPYYSRGDTSPITSAFIGNIKSLATRQDLAPTQGNPALLGLRTFDFIGRTADRYFGGNNPVRRIANIIENQRVRAKQEVDSAAPIVQKLFSLQNKYKGVMGLDGETVWANAETLFQEETMSGVFADRPLSDQKHITKGTRDAWKREQHPKLERLFNSLPEDLQQARTEAMDYFRNKQNEVSLKLIRNRIVTLVDAPDPEALATRILDRTVTDADKALLGDVYDAIEAAGALSRITGPYFPLMRRGNFVVKARIPVNKPGNAVEISESEYQFNTADEAAAFAAKQDGRPTVRTVYVDKNTGSMFGDDAGRKARLTSQDADAVARYRVAIQDRHMEMFDSMKEARARVSELRASGFDVDDAVPRQFDNFGIQGDAMSVHMRKLTSVLDRKAEERGFTAEQKHDLLGTLNEVSISMLGATRIQSRNLPRQYVAGASKDIVRNTLEYSHSMGNYVAKLDTRMELDQALKEMMDATKENAQDGFAAGRTAIANEVTRRVTSYSPISENKTMNSMVSRILSLSFVDKLMSPSYSVINATQPMMITTPYLAAHYGAARAFKAMSKAYNDIGSMQVIKSGFADTMAKIKSGESVTTDPISMIKSRLKNKGEIDLIDILTHRGVIDADSGLEVDKLVRSTKGAAGKVDAVIGYTEGISRQFPKAVEAMNRTVSALAAYRLEMERSKDHARAVQFAQDTVDRTQFNYSSSNAAPYMNHPVLRLSLQFKKYGVGMYQFLGEQAAIAIRNENPGDRARAIKALSYTVGMHVMMAGAMGLPTEPIRLMVTAANGLGLLGWTWSDVEDAQREATARLLGKDFGELVSRGVPRAMGFDLSSRMGLDSLMGPFGEPRSNEAQDWKAYIWDTVSGAPAGLVTDWAKGVNSLAEGDFVRAAERLVPMKVIADGIKSYRMVTEGNVSARSGKQTMSEYGLGEAALRTFGFQPAREAEAYERSNSFYNRRDQEADTRRDFQRQWVEASGASRGRLWRDIQKWNRGQPRNAKLTLSDLRAYQTRMKNDMKNTKEGIRARKREQHISDRADGIYNYLP